jgi:hypothetical protein
MPYAGMADAGDRADLIAHLQKYRLIGAVTVPMKECVVTTVG